MATIRHDVAVNAPADRLWAALTDIGAIHTRLAPGFVTDTKLDGENDRIVTFGNGLVARERIVTLDHDRRRIAYAIVDGRPTHHSASIEVTPDGDGACRFTWIADVLPNELEGPMGAMMADGAAAMKRTMECATAA